MGTYCHFMIDLISFHLCIFCLCIFLFSVYSYLLLHCMLYVVKCFLCMYNNLWCMYVIMYICVYVYILYLSGKEERPWPITMQRIIIIN